MISVVNDISRKPDQERRGVNVSQSKRVDIPPHKNLSQLIYLFLETFQPSSVYWNKKFVARERTTIKEGFKGCSNLCPQGRLKADLTSTQYELYFDQVIRL